MAPWSHEYVSTKELDMAAKQLIKTLTDSELCSLLDSPIYDANTIATSRVWTIARAAIEDEICRRHPDRARARKYHDALIDIRSASRTDYADESGNGSGLSMAVDSIIKQALSDS